jgi:hypothetical protein
MPMVVETYGSDGEKKVLRQKKSFIFFRYFETSVAQSSTFCWIWKEGCK